MRARGACFLWSWALFVLIVCLPARTLAQQPTALEFYTLAPCRVLDTRNPNGPLGGPALAGSARRDFTVTGVCGIPSTAASLSVNITVAGPAAGGFLSLFPGNGSNPGTSTINFSPGRTRANNAVLRLATDGSGTFAVQNGSNGEVPFIMDVNGYFRAATAGPPVSITSFTAARSTIAEGSSTTLTPIFVNETSAGIDNGVGSVTSGTPYTVAPVSTTTYTLTVNGPGGPVTASTTVTVVPAPSITVQPASQSVDIGATPDFSVAASGTGPLSYQWSKDGTPIGGATSSGYTAPAVVFADSGAVFTVVVSDTYGGSTASAAAILTVLPDLPTWLDAHPNVAAAIKWQFQPANDPFMGSYAPPAETDKIAWASWSQTQKDDLTQAYLDAKAWLAQGAPQAAMPIGGLSDEPANLHPGTGDNSGSVLEWVTPAYMWKLYIAHIGFALALEITHTVPWSLADDSDESLRYLFDSSVMGWYLTNGNFSMGTYAGPVLYFPALRANNRPQTAFAPPMWTYPFLKQAGLVGSTRLETMGNVLQWMRLNLWHFFGPATMGTYDAVWQYRGFVPLSKIVNGSVDANNPGYGIQHWTAGCHGSVAFLHEVLRVVNVPVQPVWVAGHELAYFTSERLYLDHGDDPYNQIVKSHPVSPILSLLIDEATYQSWFTPDLTINITDPYSPALANVGRRAAEFP